ncbi:hypothetical protein EB796_025298 [Bugula neritina]|uniref:Endoglycoceramidase n=1 Tax=Bugula neritina TaxID=10212 RepID=A0A7J7ISP5_BUGNE|nr:hypothetical protein EB796_025298 [Bugula neritina]
MMLAVHASMELTKMKIDNSKPGHPFVDKLGRTRVFHGINEVQKEFPWYPSLLLESKRLDEIASWGFNVVRLGMMWSGVEVAPFKVNETYIKIMDIIITSLSKRGIYVILDMHQDALSSNFGTYDGAPKWLVDSLPAPSNPYPFPFSKNPGNFNYDYVTTACGQAFANIYNNESQALDHLGFFWKTVASRFGHYDNVLGYELINEPWPGDVLSDPLLFLPGHTGSTVLQPLYEKISSFIRSVDEETIIFYEPVTWGMIIHGDTLGTGFSHVPGGDKYKDRSVLSFHYYCWFAGFDDKNPFPTWLRDLCDKLFFPQVLSTVSKDIKDTGGGMFLTEFGLCQATAPHDSTEYQECLSVLNLSDGSLLSWTYWDSAFYYSNGTAILDNVKLFGRTYAMAVAGQAQKVAFNSKTSALSFCYTPDPQTTAPTVIYANPVHYPQGFAVNVTSATYKIVNNNYIEVTASTVKHNVTVVVTRRDN